MGISSVKGFISIVTPSKDGTVALSIIMTDWASVIPLDQPSYDTPTAPGSGNIGMAWLTSSDFTTGVYENAPKSNVNAWRMLHNYGGSACVLPTENKWARTEVRRYLCREIGYSTSTRTNAIGAIVAGAAASVFGERSAEVLWLYKDGTYSAAYAVTV